MTVITTPCHRSFSAGIKREGKSCRGWSVVVWLRANFLLGRFKKGGRHVERLPSPNHECACCSGDGGARAFLARHGFGNGRSVMGTDGSDRTVRGKLRTQVFDQLARWQELNLLMPAAARQGDHMAASAPDILTQIRVAL